MSKVAQDDDTIMQYISNNDIENLSKIDDIEKRIREFNDNKQKIINASSYGSVDKLITDITKFKTKKIISYIQNNEFDKLSKIDNIDTILEKMYVLKNFKKLVDDKFKTFENLITLIKTSDEELLKELEKIKEYDATDSKSTSFVPDAKATSEETQADTNTLFEAKLKEMEEKLPPKLVDNENKGDDFLSYGQVADKEFCYKFLYCYLNNKDNQTDEIKAICKEIFNVYKMENGNSIEDFSKYVNNNIISNITFDVGFIINIKFSNLGGASAIPTQKRRKHKKHKKANHTIKKERVKTR
jgi:hypothetical protein